jgi:predicted anti-sigma-YlaC factor YlaD
MSQHYSEADLLETYYTQPGESLPVMMHLADCSECAARYERLERKIRSLSECAHHAEKPESFWARQRTSILRKVDRQRQQSAFARVSRLAAAAVLALVLGGVITWNRTNEVQPTLTATVATAEPTNVVATDTAVSADPWESEELDEFGSMVAWESWDEKATGDQSL